MIPERSVRRAIDDAPRTEGVVQILFGVRRAGMDVPHALMRTMSERDPVNVESGPATS